VTRPRDPTLDVLLDLDGQVLVVDPKGDHWVRFVVTRVPMSPEKPHGLDYSLTLHGANGERLVGFDNAHPVGRQKRGDPQDHRHTGCVRSGLMTIETRQLCWAISRTRWTQCWAREESFHDDPESGYRQL
jgi:hypothetical protein